MKSFKQFFTENSEWSGWEQYTSIEKDELKEALKGYINHLRSIYHEKVVSTDIFLINKAIGLIDETDPTSVAKTLAKLSSDIRWRLGDFVDDKASKEAQSIYYFLHDKISQYVQAPVKPTPDFTLPKALQYKSKEGKLYTNDVSIFGLEDMRPAINLGYGRYTLDKEFINKRITKQNIYLDSGLGIVTVNLGEVMQQVYDKIIEMYPDYTFPDEFKF